MLFDERDERIKKYPRFLRDYYFSNKKETEEKINSFFTAIPSNSVVLEGACGKRSKIRECNSNNPNVRMVIGVDLSEDSIKLNNNLDFKIIANLENLPFKKNYFNVVNLQSVVEHLQNPEKVFREVVFILKKEGVLLISTQNIYNPIMSVQRLLPLGIRYWIKRKILKSPGLFQDTFPAPYRCNSPRKIKKVLVNLGFKEEYMRLWGWPLIKTPSIGLFFSMIFEKLTDKKWLLFAKPNILAKFRKV